VDASYARILELRRLYLSLLEVKDLHVSVDGKEILKGVNLTVEEKRVHVLLGPNGVGKSCLLMTIMGIPIYKVDSGKVTFDGEEISNFSIDKRAKRGIGLAFQISPAIRGVKLGDLIRLCGGEEVDKYIMRSSLRTCFKNRDVNLGFSGGERKRSELAQLFAMRPKLLLLDEIDSGIDIEGLESLGKEINSFIAETGCSSLMITHLGYILRYVNADRAHVLLDGRLVRSGDPEEILDQIKERGFGGANDG